MKRDKHKELMELMQIPEIEEIVLAKLEQVKLIFKEEIRDNFRGKRQNIIDFPTGKKKTKLIRRLPMGKHAILIDTTNIKRLSPTEKLELFNETIANDPKIRKILMEIFFVQLLPFTESEMVEGESTV